MARKKTKPIPAKKPVRAGTGRTAPPATKKPAPTPIVGRRAKRIQQESKIAVHCSARGCDNLATADDGLCDDCRAEFEKSRREIMRTAAEESGLRTHRRNGGFNQYAAKWNVNQTHFNMETDQEVSFYGWYRRTRAGTQLVHAVDVFAKFKTSGGVTTDLAVESMCYAEDPRKDLKCLNADVCAAANKWFFHRVNADVQTLEQIVKQAQRPTFIINRFETLDTLILRLKEVRKTAIHSGGTRIIELKGDRNTDGVVGAIQLNLTAQAMALDGKIPDVRTAVMYDVVLEDEGGTLPDATTMKAEAKRAKPSIKKGAKEDRPQRLSVAPASGNVQDLLDQLVKARAAGDKTTQRKIRATLRSIGHTGGTRGMKGDE